ncbi:MULTISPECIES: peptidylprolyl isomerase [Terrabacteria group]|uniref:foldase protein PrsA n=1 Tax=Bacillati TaxID=1783272 RepID=UPI00193AC3FC|nr:MULTISPECIES: peptidylprolyl isomerase [Terrabacteria group]MBW9212357.1 peptidylprolyl isomerase [Trueperella sp. zg.1013]QRG86110.1 peptidylprolyl isomerase [Bulleidia sp. zg-1006]
MGKFLKKNWFVMLIVIIFIGISVYYIYDTNKGKLKGKKINGEDVVFTVDNNNVTANNLYDELYRLSGKSALTTFFKQKVADMAISTTNTMKDTSAAQKKTIIARYEQKFGTNYEAKLRTDLQPTGYTDLEEYLLNQQKISQIAADYAKKHFDELKIRQISYILVKFENAKKASKTPTEKEKAKMDAVDKELKAGTAFSKVAAKHTEDTSAVANGGKLGIIDKNTSKLDSSFKEAALALNEGEVSQWIYSSNFGFFKIKADATTANTLGALNAKSNPFLQLVNSYDNTLGNPAIWEKAKELGVDFKGNKELENTLKASLGVKESEAK